MAEGVLPEGQAAAAGAGAGRGPNYEGVSQPKRVGYLQEEGDLLWQGVAAEDWRPLSAGFSVLTSEPSSQFSCTTGSNRVSLGGGVGKPLMGLKADSLPGWRGSGSGVGSGVAMIMIDRANSPMLEAHMEMATVGELERA